MKYMKFETNLLPKHALINGGDDRQCTDLCFRKTVEKMKALLGKAKQDGASVEQPASCNQAYTVKAGDTLWAIAKQHGVALDELIAANPQIANPDLIYPDQVINIPGGGDSGGGPQGDAPITPVPGGDWMEIARGELGQSEIAGAQHNPRIVEYHSTTGLHANTDETHWCSSFVNWTMEKAGFPGTDDARAISWTDWGQASELKPGAIVVIKNRETGQHHVGFYVEGQAGNLTLLGGNQSNTVKLSTFGGKHDILAVRSPNGQ